jgi:peptidoglycan L-alanyl-D-glutamate endopeptidase CwlK
MPNPSQRDSNLTYLHPTLRTKAQVVLDDCTREQLPFRLFEGFRSPQRQQYLYEQGRTRPGTTVTNARPWTSYHQYGLAADFVLYQDGQWSWESTREKAGWWNRLHEIGRAQGLEPLSWETPHLQLSGVSISDLQEGRYPPDGDAAWAESLEVAIISWMGTPQSPPAPTLLPQRPPLGPEVVERVASGELPPAPSAEWHGRFGGREWRHDAGGVYLRDHADGKQPLRTPGDPVTCRTIWQLFAEPILAASRMYSVHPAIIMMGIATETAFARKAGFTGPLTFRWEPHVPVTDVNPARLGDYSAGPMQLLGTTARGVIRGQGLDYEPFVVAPALEYGLDEPDSLPLYGPATSIDIGTATIAQGLAKTGDDPILIAAAYNAGGLYKSTKNAWGLKTTGDHLDRAARWYGDACAVLREAQR